MKNVNEKSWKRKVSERKVATLKETNDEKGGLEVAVFSTRAFAKGHFDD